MLMGVLEPRYRWCLPVASPSPELLAAGHALGITDRLVGILAGRGVDMPGELEGYLGAPEDGLHDPRLLPDADRLLARIRRAQAGRERILVFGDFDADGLTGLAILVGALRRLGLDAEPYVPSRLAEGHGLSLQAVDNAAANGRTLIVTVDCGTTSHAEVAAAGRRGIDVVITDHHRVPLALPAAVAVVNPQRPDAKYPDRRLAGSGVAFKVAQLLLADEPGGPAAAIGFSDLASIGTVADVAPVLGENRAIVRLGLERLRSGARPGLAALMAAAGLRPEGLDVDALVYAVAPRLNAAGRVGEAIIAARLLLAEDFQSAGGLAAQLEDANSLRREVTRSAVDDARGAPPTDEAAVVVRGDWPVGVIGLVAARLADERNRPAVVATELEGLLRGSCRSPGGFDLGVALEACGDLLIRHGGHAGAAGFEMEADHWTAFCARFVALATAAGPRDPRRELRLDVALPAPQVDYALVADLDRLAPTGPGNPEPLVGVLGTTVVRVRAANGGHTQLTLRRDRDVVDAIAFGRADLVDAIREGDRLDVAARLLVRHFGGYESLQLEVRDVAPAGHFRELAMAVQGI